MHIVLRVHGLGANLLGCYGNEWIATPNLDRLASGGTVYDNCYGVETLPATIVDPRNGGRPLAIIRSTVAAATSDLVIETDALAEPWYSPEELIEDYPDVSDRMARLAAAVTYLDAEIGALIDSVPHATWTILGIGGTAWDVPTTEDRTHVAAIHSVGDGSRIPELVTFDSNTFVRSEMVTTVLDGVRIVRTADWTRIDRDPPRLYRRPQDRDEVQDVSRENEEVVEELNSRDNPVLH